MRTLFLALILSTSCYTEQIWENLQNGNLKYLKNKQLALERAATADKQNPGIVILGCADSRTPPEILFSQGIGQFFTCRVAGQVADEVVVDSIEFAVSHFNVEAIVVLGHTNCGAVLGALKHLKNNGGVIDPSAEGHLNAVLRPIEAAILEAKIDINAPDALDLATKANIRYVADQLMLQSPTISKAVKNGSLCIIGAEYDLSSGVAKQHFLN